MADKIRAAFADAVAAADLAGPPTTISMGIATGYVDRSDLAGLLSDADTALYRAKNHGRDRVAA